MDASALIFVALAVAWAAYLIPKALEHHEEGVRSRTIDKFSSSMRVIARREPVGRGKAELVTPRRTPAAAVVNRRKPRASAARRRRRVLGLVLLANVVVVGLAAAGVVAWVWVAIPAVLVAVWLVACRLMVKRERRPALRRTTRPVPARQQLEEATEAVTAQAEPAQPVHPVEITPADVTEEQAAVSAEVAPDGTWDPQSVPLPTYVSKPPAPRRSVRQIDLDSTGVWSSGPSESDSQLVRDADQAAKAARAQAETHRHSG